MQKIYRFFGKYKLQIIILALIVVVFSSFTRALFKTTLFTFEIFPDFPIKPLALFTKEPVRREVVYKSADREIHADLYLPNEKGKNPAVVLDLGLDIDKTDERVVRFADALARSGIIVLSPNIPSISGRRLNEESVEDFINSYKYLNEVARVDNEKSGFFTFCSAGAVSFLASQSEDLGRIPFIISINPFYSITSLHEEVVLSRSGESSWRPNPKTSEILQREIIFHLENDTDKKILSDSFLNLLKKDLAGIDTETLTEDGLNTYSYLSATNGAKLNEYISKATPKQKKGLENLSPSTRINQTDVSRIFILAEENFEYVPASEGRRLNDALKGVGKDPEFTNIELDFQKKSFANNMPDVFKIFLYIFSVLSYLEN